MCVCVRVCACVNDDGIGKVKYEWRNQCRFAICREQGVPSALQAVFEVVTATLGLCENDGLWVWLALDVAQQVLHLTVLLTLCTHTHTHTRMSRVR